MHWPARPLSLYYQRASMLGAPHLVLPSWEPSACLEHMARPPTFGRSGRSRLLVHLLMFMFCWPGTPTWHLARSQVGYWKGYIFESDVVGVTGAPPLEGSGGSLPRKILKIHISFPAFYAFSEIVYTIFREWFWQNVYTILGIELFDLENT